MSMFVGKLRSINGYNALKGVEEEKINEAENMLELKFAKDYKEYLLECGVATAENYEFTGIIDSKRLNVVEVTAEEKLKNKNIPKDLYVVERLDIDGCVIWQSEDGEIYQTVMEGKPVKIAKSLCEYIDL